MDEAGVLELVIDEHISGCAVRNDGGVRVVAGILHPQGREDILLDECLVTASGYSFDQISKQHIPRVTVAPLLAGLEVKRLVAETPHHLLSCGGKRFELCIVGKAGEVRDARRVSQKMKDGDLIPGSGSIRQVLLDWIAHA